MRVRRIEIPFRLQSNLRSQKRILKTGKTVHCHIETGLLDKRDTAAMKRLMTDANAKL